VWPDFGSGQFGLEDRKVVVATCYHCRLATTGYLDSGARDGNAVFRRENIPL
jgi:hypothetical protein